MEGNLDIVKYLVEQGADIEVLDFEDNTLVDIAYLYENDDVAEYLMDIGAW
jgi:ankyrin repeat protein